MKNYRVRSRTRNKHGAKSDDEDNIYFPSEGERNRYRELKLMLKAGEIKSLLVHPRYPIIIEDVKICVMKIAAAIDLNRQITLKKVSFAENSI